MRKQSENKTGKRAVYVAGLLAAAVAVIWLVVPVFQNSSRSGDGYDEVRSEAVREVSLLPAEQSSSVEETTPETTDTWDGADAVLAVDFEKLLQENPDTIAWLHVPGANISYPVLHAADNDYYLYRAFDRSDSAAGSIFLECTNQPAFTDCNSLIYGHNMFDGTMFGYLQEAFSRKNAMADAPYFYLYFPDGTVNRYGIFSFYETSQGSDTFSVFTADDAYDYYIYYARTLSETSVSPADPALFTAREPLVTLSTCAGPAGTTKRFALHGILCDSKKM